MPNHPRESLKHAKIEDLSWMTGQWTGSHGSDLIEEHWSAPAANAMMGMFRWYNNESVRFYELITLEQEPQGVVMRIKHFHPRLKGWEEKDQSIELWVTVLEKDRVVFNKANSAELKWLIYEQIGPTEMLVYFDLEAATGRDNPFRFLRQRP